MLFADICEGSRISTHSSTSLFGLHQVMLPAVSCHAEGVNKYSPLCLFGNARIFYTYYTPDMYCTSVMMYVPMYYYGCISCFTSTPLANSFPGIAWKKAPPEECRNTSSRQDGCLRSCSLHPAHNFTCAHIIVSCIPLLPQPCHSSLSPATPNVFAVFINVCVLLLEDKSGMPARKGNVFQSMHL